MTAHWGIEDPAVEDGTDIQKEAAFVLATRYLRNRISILDTEQQRAIYWTVYYDYCRRFTLVELPLCAVLTLDGFALCGRRRCRSPRSR
jgi:hypothetical protein